MRHLSSTRRAFTLVELLVVIGIIALLISILLPAMSKAREQGNTVKCLTNLRSIAQACAMYTNDSKGYIIPCATNPQGWWPSILVDNNYLKAPRASAAIYTSGASPLTDGNIFFCPNGNMEMFPPDLTNNTAVPASRTDARGAMAYESTAPGSNLYVHFWYGINGDEGKDTTKGAPTRRIQNLANDGYIKTNHIRKPTEMVFMFDGLIYHHLSMNANRLNARHNGNRYTNISFFDSHVETWRTADLPGGDGAASTSEFSITNLRTKYNHQSLKWRLEQ